MSLLIKALDKAEKDQAKNSNTAKTEVGNSSSDWSLESINEEPTSTANQVSSHSAEIDEISVAGFNDSTLLSTHQSQLTGMIPSVSRNRTSKTQSQPAQSTQNQTRLNQQEQAANVFGAKRLDNTKDTKQIALIGFVSLFAILLIGAGLYSYYATKPALPTKPSFTQTPPKTSPVIVEVVPTVMNQPDTNQAPVIGTENTSINMPSLNTKVTESVETKKSPLQSKNKTMDKDIVISGSSSKLEANDSVVNNPSPKNSKRVISSASTTVTITRNKPDAGINPILLSAYQAYTAGDDAKAQKLYKQVLQTETRNIDAMLGLAAIAQGQNRIDDTAGWYRKVLELDPKNTIAQSSLINIQLDNSGQADPIASESRLKNLLAQQPENASLQAALGSLYADQNQWPSAQQAYFEAHRLAPSNADYTFNLAASLDQMGKPKLALPFYQRTLELLPTSANNGVSEAVVKARIQAIE